MISSREMKMNALLARKKMAHEDDIELEQRIFEAAAAGELMLCYVKNSKDEYPTISAECIKRLKENGYKIDIWYKDGWDNLHRYYKGALKVSWFK